MVDIKFGLTNTRDLNSQQCCHSKLYSGRRQTSIGAQLYSGWLRLAKPIKKKQRQKLTVLL